MITHDKIRDGLRALTLRLANERDTPPPEYSLAEWAYIKGAASAVILQHIVEAESLNDPLWPPQ